MTHSQESTPYDLRSKSSTKMISSSGNEHLVRLVLGMFPPWAMALLRRW